MKALVKLAPGRGNMELREVPEPEAGSGQVKVAVRSAGICGTDLHIFDDEYPSRPPVVMGHEMAGEVVEVGDGVAGVGIGDRVTALPFAVTCGRCEHCLQGEPALCPDRLSFGSGVDGAFAPYLVLPAHLLRPLPADLSFDAGAVVEPLACCAKAVLGLTSLRPGDTVLVSGPGQIGLLSLQLARAQGARVLLTGMAGDESRLAVGRELGAERVLRIDRDDVPGVVADLTRGKGVDIVLECAGTAAAVDAGLRLLRKKGQLTQLGLSGKPWTLDLDQVVFKDLRVVGSYSSNLRSWDRALSLVEAGTVRLAPLISAALPLDDWEKGFAMARGKKGLKVVLRPSD